MRVLHVTRDFPPHVKGGISVAVGGMVAALRANGIDVAVLSFDAWRPRSQRGTAPMHRPATAAPSVGHVLRVSSPSELTAAHAFAFEYGPDVIHVHHAMLWPFAAELRSALGVPAIKSVHVVQRAVNEVRGVDERTLSLRGQEEALAGADLVLAPSRAAAELLLSYCHSDRAPSGAPVGDRASGLVDRLRIVPHGVHDTDLARRGADREARREPIVLYAGRFDDVKGTADFFAAIPAILSRAPAARIEIAGGLPGNRRAERKWLDVLAGAPAPATDSGARLPPRRSRSLNGSTDRCRYLGWLTADGLSRRYAAAAIVVVPSRTETFGLTAAEAMLHGAAVVAARTGALAELISDGDTGILIEAGDPNAIADAVVDLLDRPADVTAIGRRAAAEIRRAWLWEQRLPALLTAYDEARPHWMTSEDVGERRNRG